MRSNTWVTRTAAILASAVGCAFSVAQPPAPRVSKPPTPTPSGEVDLRPKFKPGQQIRYSFDQTAKSTLKSQDPTDAALDQDQLQTEHIALVLKVIESTDEGSTIQVVYESIKVRLMTPDGPAEYDSTKPPPKKPAPTQPAPTQPAPTHPAPPASRFPAKSLPPAPDPLKDIADMDISSMLGLVVGPMVGTTITVKTDKFGAISSVSGGDSLGGPLSGLGGMGASLVPSPSAVANWLVAGLGGPGNKGLARVGESWTNSDALSGTPIGAFKMTTTHTLKAASAGTANVSFIGGLEPASQSATPAGVEGVGGSGFAQIQSATYTGTYAWDTRAGALAEMATNLRVSMEGGLTSSKTRMTSETQIKVRRQ